MKRLLGGGDTPFVKPNVSHCIQENEVHYNPLIDYSKMYLTFVSLEDGNEISWYCGEYDVVPITYSTDNGNTWETYTAESSGTSQLLATINKDEKILFKGNTAKYGGVDWNEDYAYGASFISSKQLNIEGNIMSLVYGDDFANNGTTPSDFDLSGLFHNNSGFYEGSLYVVDASNLILPLETLTENCYAYMFDNCTSITTAPELPATTLAEDCYFAMFHGCTSLTTTPALPATTLEIFCYGQMFYGCTSLTTAPELPATTLAEKCYGSMFANCTSLTTAPELPATTLANYCYQYMFNGCTNLNYIKAMFTTTPSNSYTNQWVSGVAANGTFVKNAAATWDVTGVNGIPSGWTVETATA